MAAGDEERHRDLPVYRRPELKPGAGTITPAGFCAFQVAVRRNRSMVVAWTLNASTFTWSPTQPAKH